MRYDDGGEYKKMYRRSKIEEKIKMEIKTADMNEYVDREDYGTMKTDSLNKHCWNNPASSYLSPNLIEKSETPPQTIPADAIQKVKERLKNEPK